MGFSKGDILVATDRTFRAGRHFIIYWEDADGPLFQGLMLTHSTKYRNIMLEKRHVEVKDDSGTEFDFQWDKSHVVDQLFYKYDEWGPFTKIGRLAKSGIDFLTEQLSNDEAKSFSEYYYRLKNL